jgi:hypothetical protein
MRQAIIRLVGVTDLLSATSSSYTVDMVKLAAGMNSWKAETEYTFPNDQLVCSLSALNGREMYFLSLIFHAWNFTYLSLITA